jgi:predicted nucleotidyltransferase
MSGRLHSIQLTSEELSQVRLLAQSHGFENVRLFCSLARGEGGPDSDIDLLVRLGPGRGFRDLMDFCDEAERVLRRRVDVVVEDGLSALIRDLVLDEVVAL